jgi:cytochrome b561
MKVWSGYSRLQIALHWGMLALLLVSFFSHDAMKSAWYALHKGKDAFGTVAALHVWVGVSVLVLAILRLGLRHKRGVPDLPAGGHPLLDLVARLTHLGLYLLLILIPASGLAAWFGGVNAAGDAHEIMFNLALALVGLHVAGALYHQFFLKDGLMDRMRRPE